MTRSAIGVFAHFNGVPTSIRVDFPVGDGVYHISFKDSTNRCNDLYLFLNEEQVDQLREALRGGDVCVQPDEGDKD